MSRTTRKLVVKVLTLTALTICLTLISSPDFTKVAYASACSECWDACRQEGRSCGEFCTGCPYGDDRYFQSSTGHTIECAGGVGQCMSNCSYAEMLCYDNCNYSSCGFPL